MIRLELLANQRSRGLSLRLATVPRAFRTYSPRSKKNMAPRYRDLLKILSHFNR